MEDREVIEAAKALREKMDSTQRKILKGIVDQFQKTRSISDGQRAWLVRKVREFKAGAEVGIERLVNCFGSKSYPEERIKLLDESLKREGVTKTELDEVIDYLIATERSAPMIETIMVVIRELRHEKVKKREALEAKDLKQILMNQKATEGSIFKPEDIAWMNETTVKKMEFNEQVKEGKASQEEINETEANWSRFQELLEAASKMSSQTEYESCGKCRNGSMLAKPIDPDSEGGVKSLNFGFLCDCQHGRKRQEAWPRWDGHFSKRFRIIGAPNAHSYSQV